jgi:conjugal transfer pilus assembly protein TraK
VRALKGMLVAMAADRPPTDIRVDEVNRPIQLWQEAKFALVRLYEGRGLVGERYVLTNVSTQDMVLAEQEFDRERGGVLAVSIENHNLRPGESTSVYVIRQGS